MNVNSLFQNLRKSQNWKTTLKDESWKTNEYHNASKLGGCIRNTSDFCDDVQNAHEFGDNIR